MSILEPEGWKARAACHLPCPKCFRPLALRTPVSPFLMQCPACGRNPMLYFAGVDAGSFLGEPLALLLFEYRLISRDALEDLIDAKKAASPHGLLSYAMAAGYVKEAGLVNLGHRLGTPAWREAMERLTGGTRGGPTRLQQVLDKHKLVSPERMHRALSLQRERGGPLARILLDLGYLTETDVLRALAEDLGMPFVDLDRGEIPAALHDEVPPAAALLYEALPVAMPDGVLTVAVADPLNGSVLEDLEIVMGRQIHGAVAAPRALRRCLERQYGGPPEAVERVLAQGRDLPIIERHLGFLVMLLLKHPQHRLALSVTPDQFAMSFGPPGRMTPIPLPPAQIVRALAARLAAMAGAGAAANAGREEPRSRDATTLNISGRSGRLMLVHDREGSREEFTLALEPLRGTRREGGSGGGGAPVIP
ncbi:MAG: hypothetical protein HZA54_21070 [Planctomycetes bacterium]|nr:hypothetical protein [Planctomycetota bacterium]